MGFLQDMGQSTGSKPSKGSNTGLLQQSGAKDLSYTQKTTPKPTAKPTATPTPAIPKTPVQQAQGFLSQAQSTVKNISDTLKFTFTQPKIISPVPGVEATPIKSSVFNITPTQKKIAVEQLKSAFPQTTQAFQEAKQGIKETLNTKKVDIKSSDTKMIKQAGIDAWDVIKGAFSEGIKRTTERNFTKSKTPAEALSKELKYYSGVANAALSPISAVFAALNNSNARSVTKALAVPFVAAGEGAYKTSDAIIDTLPLDKKTKETLKPAFAEASSLAAQFALGELIHISTKKATGTIGKIGGETFEKFTKTVIEESGSARTVNITKEQAQNVLRNIGDKATADLFKTLDVETRVEAVKKGVTIEIPAEKITRLVDKPYWEKIKSFFGKEATDITTTTPGTQTARAGFAGYLTDGTYTPQEVIGKVMSSGLEKTPEGKAAIKAAIEAQKTEQNIVVSTTTGGVETKVSTPTNVIKPKTSEIQAKDYTSASDYADAKYSATENQQIGEIDPNRIIPRDPVDKTSKEYKALTEDIKANGMKDPIRVTVENGKIITTDGSQRSSIAQDLGIKARVIVNSGSIDGLKTIADEYNAGLKKSKAEEFVSSKKTKLRVAEEKKDLVVLHNLNESGLLKANKMGGLPVPSLAITKKNIPFEGFGEISLVGDSKFATREDVYTSDIYTRRVPRQQYKINSAQRDQAIIDLRPYLDKTGGENYRGVAGMLNDSNLTPKELIRRASDDNAVRAMYLKEAKGIDIGTNEKPRNMSRDFANGQLGLYTRSLADSPLVKSIITSGKWKSLEGVSWSDEKDNPVKWKKAIKLANEIVADVEKSVAKQYQKFDPAVAKLMKDSAKEMFFEENGTFLPTRFDMVVYKIRDYARKGTTEIDTERTSKIIESKFKKVDIKDYENWVTSKFNPVFGRSIFYDNNNIARNYTLENIMTFMTGRVRGQENFFYGAGSIKSKISKKLTSLEEVKKNAGLIQPEAKTKKIHDKLQDRLGNLIEEIKAASEWKNSDSFGIWDQIGKDIASVGTSITEGRVRSALRRAGVSDPSSELVSSTLRFLKDLRDSPVGYFEVKPQRVVNLSEFPGALVPKGASPEAIQVLKDQNVKVVMFDPKIEGDRSAKLQANFKDEMFRLKDDFKALTGVEMTNAQEAELIKLNKQIFGDTDIKIVGQILANKDALGSYREGIIKVVAGQADPKATLYHEAVHKYLDVFTTKEEHVDLLMEAQNKYNIEDFAQVEEKIAEDFINYAKSREGFVGKIKLIFDQIIARIKAYFKNIDKIDQLYQDILVNRRTPEEILADQSLLSSDMAKEQALKETPQSKKVVEQLTEKQQAIEQAKQENQVKKSILDQFNTPTIRAMRAIKRSVAALENKGLDPTNVSNSQSYKDHIDDVMAALKTTSEDVALNYIINDLPDALTSASTREQLQEIRVLKSRIEPKEVSVPRSQLPVGEGKATVTAVESKMRGVTKNVTDIEAEQLGLSKSNTAHNDQQINGLSEYVVNHTEEAIKVAQGKIEPPEGYLRNAVFVALTKYSEIANDMTLTTKLSALSSKRFGQEIQILSQLDPNSPVKLLNEVYDVKEEVFKQRHGGQTFKEVKEKIVKKALEKAKRPDKYDINKLIDLIETC